jgi:DNA-directed RNA polymerase subunit RPC12/RpoP
MATWNLECANCHKTFWHSDIKETELMSLYFPEKPSFPAGGAELECPHCGHKATYQQHRLFYRG